MPDNGKVSDATLRLLNLDRATYDRIRSSFEQDMDMMGVYEFVLFLVKSFSLNKKEEIVQVLESEGLKIVTSEKHVFDRPEAVRFAIIRAQGKGTPLDVQEHTATLDSLLQGPAEAVIVAGREAGVKLRELLGPADPQAARQSHPTSLRARFGGKRLSENGLHCSMQREETHQELSLLFPNYTEILKSKGYASQVDQWLWTLWRSEPHQTIFSSSFLNIVRYPGKNADRYQELKGMLSKMFAFVIRIMYSVVGSLASLTSLRSASLGPSLRATASESSLSNAEEEDIARAVLAEELGIVFSEPQVAPMRPKGQLDVPSMSHHRELGESAREKLFTSVRPDSRKQSSPQPSNARSDFNQRPTTSGFGGVTSAADMYRRSNRNVGMHHQERISQWEASDITDELLDLHGAGALFP